MRFQQPRSTQRSISQSSSTVELIAIEENRGDSFVQEIEPIYFVSTRILFVLWIFTLWPQILFSLMFSLFSFVLVHMAAAATESSPVTSSAGVSFLCSFHLVSLHLFLCEHSAEAAEAKEQVCWVLMGLSLSVYHSCHAIRQCRFLVRSIRSLWLAKLVCLCWISFF